MLSEELIKELPGGILRWFDFNKGENALYIQGTKNDVSYVTALEDAGLILDRINFTDINRQNTLHDKEYDYIIIMGILELSESPEDILRFAREHITDTGKILIGTDNRLAVRYFCGDRDPFTGRNFDGIENYTRIDPKSQGDMEGRAYDKAQLTHFLQCAGIEEYKFYSILPEMTCPQIIIADGYKPQEELNVRILPQYNYPETVFLEEVKLYTTLLNNNMFHQMANGYLIECGKKDCLNNACQVTISMERGRENAMCTIIREDRIVEKKAIYEEGRKKITALKENNEYLSNHGVRMIEGNIEKDSFVMPYTVGKPATEYVKDLLLVDGNVEKFYEKLDELWNIILNSSDSIDSHHIDWDRFEPDWEKRKPDDPDRYRWRNMAQGTKEEQLAIGPILKRGYMDLVTLNAFSVNDEFIFYDQELYMKNVPAKAIFIRSLDFIYGFNDKMNLLVPREEVVERFGLKTCERLFRRFIDSYLDNLRNDTPLRTYHELRRADAGVLNSNRQRMNYSTDEYERIFRDIFRGTEGRDIYLFGSGNFTKKFLSQFGKDYRIAGIVDNNKEKWSSSLQDIKIYSPDYLLGLPQGSFKVIVCIKNYVPVIRQLEDMNINNYGIFDSNMKYPRVNHSTGIKADKSEEDGKQSPKKYHTGYIAGVFDLFHIGHLNMFKRAKEQCDYLIVGVVNDESVMKSKRTTPYIPFEERIEIVRSCKYVDEAVEIPTDYGDTDEAYRRYQFDVQFSGSDYENDPDWLAKKAFLQKQGADLVFFPYTESTSSTKLKAAINNKK